MNSFTQFQLRYFQRHLSSNWIAARYLVFAVVLNAALVPLWFYLDDGRKIGLAVIGVVVGITHLLLIFRTMRLGSLQFSLQSEAELDLIALTGVSAWHLIYGKWAAICRFIWKDFLLFAILRLGLAIGIAEYLHTISCMPIVNDMLCYQSIYPYPWTDFYSNRYRLPTVGMIFAGLVILVIFSMLECGLCAAIGMLVSTRLRRQSSAVHLSVAGLIRVVIALISIVLWRLLWTATLLLRLLPAAYNQQELATWRDSYYLSYFVKYSQLSVLNLADAGTILSAQYMRPSWGVITNILYSALSTVEGILLYVGVIALILFLTYKFLRRRGFVSV